MGLSFGQVVDVLSEANGLSSSRRERFISRLKQWQKMGFPQGVNVGKGARADYGAKQLFQLAFLMRMLALGLTPERAQSILKTAWDRVQDAITSVTMLSAETKGGGHYLLVRMDALTELKDGHDGHMHIYVYPITRGLIADALQPDDEGLTDDQIRQIDELRIMVLDMMVDALIIEVDSIVWRIWGAMTKLGIPPSALTDDLKKWVKEFAKRQRAETKEDPKEHPGFVDNLADVEFCYACFAGELLGLKGQDHDCHLVAEGAQNGDD